MNAWRTLILCVPFIGACAPSRLSNTPKAPFQPDTFELGVNIHLDTLPRLAALPEMGARWVRVDLNWDGIEPQSGHFDFSAPDQSICDARSLGLNVFATLAYTPAWASLGRKNTSVPYPAAWRHFVATCARRYQGSVAAYGIWNEPNLEEFWDGSAEDYVNVLLIPAHDAIKAEDPSALVAGPDLAHLYSARLGLAGFYQTLSRLHGDRYLDVITHHLYGADDFAQKLNGFKLGNFIYRRGLQQILEDANLDRMNVWITELGSDARLGEMVQAELLSKQLPMLRDKPWIKRAFVYQLYDDAGSGAKWGLMRADGSPKPAYYAAKFGASPVAWASR